MAHILKKGLKGSSVMAAVVSVVFTIVAGPIVGGLIACATGLICGGGGGGSPVSGGQVAPNAPCNSAPNACGQTSLGFFVPAACSGGAGNGDQENGEGLKGGQSGTGNRDQESGGVSTPTGGQIGGSCIQCNAAPPSNSSCPAPTIPQTNGYYANPSVVGAGGNTTLFWNVANATDCQLSGDNGFSASGAGSGSAPTNALQQTTTFTLTCQNGEDGPTATRALRVIVAPRYREI